MNNSLMLPLLGFTMTIFTSWMLGLHVDTVSIYHSVYTTYCFTFICFESLITITEIPYKSNFYKMTGFQMVFPIFGWLLVSIHKISQRETPIWSVDDIDFLDLICFSICGTWQLYLCIKGMPTYNELFFFGVYESPSIVNHYHSNLHKIVGYSLAFIYFIQWVILLCFQINLENIFHITFNLLPLVLLTLASAILLEPQKQRSDAKIFTASNYSYAWIACSFQITLLVQSLAFLLKSAMYDSCSDCYIGINYMVSLLLLIYYPVYGFQKFTIKHRRIPNYFYDDQTLFYTATTNLQSTSPHLAALLPSSVVESTG
eukprot:NODE_947_length_2851_cov_0.490189.p1 type:complete len:315 gc:universal NODE_947_length_2851_cov_0.490189:750-1694(+)